MPTDPNCQDLKKQIRELEKEVRSLRKLEQARRETKEFLETIINHIPNQVFWKNEKLVYMGCNRHFSRVVGLDDPKHIVGMTDYDFARDASHAESYRKWDQRIIDSGDAVIDLEEKYHDSEGIEGTVLTNKVPVYDENGDCFCIVGICTDITDRKCMEEKLQRSLLWQDEAVRAADVGLWDWNLNTDKVHYSSVWKKQIGHAQDEIGDDIDEWKSRIHPDDLQTVLDQTRQCIDGQKMRYQTEFRFRHKDGAYRWILSQGSVLHDESGQPVRMVGSHMDITKREQLIGELQEALAKVKTLSGMLPICANCKKIRDDSGYWNQIESYLERHTDADFTHGYCPDCMDDMYGEKAWYRKGKRKKKL